MMAKEASLCLLFLSSLLISCSGTLVGFSYHERGENTWTSTSAEKTISFLQQSKVSSSQIRVFVTDHRILSTLTNSNVSVDLYLNKSQVEKLTTSSELKAHLVNLLPQLDIKSIIASCGSECLAQNEIPLLIHSLRSFHSTLNNILHVGREVKVSVAFPLPLLQKLNASSHEHDDIRKMLSFLKEMKSFMVIEDSIDGEYLSKRDHFVQSVIKRATLAASILPCKDVPLVLTIKTPIIPSSMEVAQFTKRVSKYLEPRTPITKRIAALYVEVHTTEDLAQKELKSEEEEEFFPLSRREILSKIHRRRTLGDTNSPSNTVFPTNPTPIITPPEDTPTIITVPSTTNPVTISPSNPAAMPVTVPSATPVPVPPTNPAVTNPATTPTPVPGSQQPVTSYPPPPSGNVPVPVTNPQPQPPPPSNTNNAPASQGQSWCVAKTGAPQASLQAALDYACGMGGADCSQIQQGGSCYSPVTLQNHASFAFNSYYQKHPAPTSCDFGGAATLVNTNPSTGSCIFPSSSSSSSTPMTPSPTPPTSSTPTPPTQSITTPPPSPTTPPPSMPTAPPTPSGAGTGTFGYGTPPSVLNSSSNPASSGGIMPGFGFDTPPVVNTTSASHSVPLKPFTGSIVLMMISFLTARLSTHP